MWILEQKHFCFVLTMWPCGDILYCHMPQISLSDLKATLFFLPNMALTAYNFRF